MNDNGHFISGNAQRIVLAETKYLNLSSSFERFMMFVRIRISTKN